MKGSCVNKLSGFVVDKAMNDRDELLVVHVGLFILSNWKAR